MTIKVLVVDDSSFFRRRVSEILAQDPELEVVATACNGMEAIAKAQEFKPNVITMDIEMPVMDGISAVREIMALNPVPILMFSSLTHDGAKATLDALEAGALDFLPKRFEDIAANKDEASLLLQQRVKTLGWRRIFRPRTAVAALEPKAAAYTSSAPRHANVRTSMQFQTDPRPSEPCLSEFRPSELRSREARGLDLGQAHVGQAGHASTVMARGQATVSGHVPVRASGKNYKLLAIGTSTGGPVALQKVLTAFPANYPLPILIIQHMPAAFTPAFAQRLDGLCRISVKEAATGDILQPGCAYLAPGGMQMMLERSPNGARIKILAGNSEINYKPSVDISFASASKFYGGDVLAVVLTGMGADGREGARMLKSLGATIWAQDEASCVVYGMPQAVTVAGLSTQSIAIEQMSDAILRETTRV